MRPTRPPSPTPTINRTPLFLGVVLIPLAASCFLHTGAFGGQRSKLASESNPLQRVLLYYALERERRVEALLPADDGELTEDQRRATEEQVRGIPAPASAIQLTPYQQVRISDDPAQNRHERLGPPTGRAPPRF